MISKERVIRAINIKPPDRIPIMHCILPGAIIQYGEKIQKIVHKYPSDFEFNNTINLDTSHIPTYQRTGTKWEDEWGCVWKNVNLYDGLEGQITGHPLADWNALAHYKFPDPLGDDWNSISRKIEASGHNRYIREFGGRLFERMQWLRGYSTVLIDLIDKEPRLKTLADGIVEYDIRRIEKLLELDIDEIYFHDDWGTQHQLMIHPKIWREFFKPYYREIVSLVRSSGKNFYFHSDGYIIDIIPDLIEIGINVLNPQFSCHNLEELAKTTVGKICICTDLDRQYILPNGSSEEVKKYVSR